MSHSCQMLEHSDRGEQGSRTQLCMQPTWGAWEQTQSGCPSPHPKDTNPLGLGWRVRVCVGKSQPQFSRAASQVKGRVRLEKLLLLTSPHLPQGGPTA